MALHASFFDAEALPPSEDPEQFPMVEQVWHGQLPLFLPMATRLAHLHFDQCDVNKWKYF